MHFVYNSNSIILFFAPCGSGRGLAPYQDHPERYSNFYRLYIKFQLCGNWLWTWTSCLEIVFQEQSYSRLHSGWSLALDHFRGDIDDPCCIIADFRGVIADPCGVVVIPEAIGGSAVADAAMPIVP